MKNLHILLLSLIISSCGSAQKVVENSTSNEIKTEIEVEVEVETEVEDEAIKENENLKVPIFKEKIKKLKDSVYFINRSMFVDKHSQWNLLLKKNVSKNGNVNYKAIKKDRKELEDYIKSLSEHLPNNKWSKKQKLAYWINAYNALTIDLIIRNYPIKSIKDIKDPWDQRLWKLGKKWYNLNEIEHQILRKMDEPRIHFAIVCASFSCPKLQNEAFTTSNLESQLTNATREFLADNKRNTITKNSLRLSKIFKWFAKDFKQNGSLIYFLNAYAEIEISAKAKKSYLDYNWDLNE